SKQIFTLEDNVLQGGFGEKVSAVVQGKGVTVTNIGWPNRFIEHGASPLLYKKYGLDSDSLTERIGEQLER
ncbi:MAG: transketolase C-terminal domain-containing protein, partial [Anaerovoracaceae bacterium]